MIVKYILDIGSNQAFNVRSIVYRLHTDEITLSSGITIRVRFIGKHSVLLCDKIKGTIKVDEDGISYIEYNCPEAFWAQ